MQHSKLNPISMGKTPPKTYLDRPADSTDYGDKLAEQMNTLMQLDKKVQEMEAKFKDRESAKHYDKTLREAQRKAEESYEKEIRELEYEKINLIKRLNLVLVDLEKLSIEKSELYRKYQEQCLITDDLKKKLSKTNDSSNQISRNLQSDILKEVEVNQKLKIEIAALEDTISRFITLSTSQNKDTNVAKIKLEEMKNLLKLKNEQLTQLDEDKLKVKLELDKSLEKLQEYEKLEKNAAQNIIFQNEDLAKLTEERDQLIFRLNELTEKYEAFANQMAKEREEISKTNKLQIKVLTSKVLFTFLDLAIKKRVGLTYNKMKELSEKKRKIEEGLKLSDKIFIRHERMLLSSGLRIWRSHFLKWENERIRNEILLNKKIERKYKFKYFNIWKLLYNRLSFKTNKKLNACREFKDILTYIEEKSINWRFKIWKREVAKEKFRESIIKHTISSWHKRNLFHAYEKISQFAQLSTLEQNCRTLAKETSTFNYKQQIFNRLKMKYQLAEEDEIWEKMVILQKDDYIRRKNRFLKTVIKITSALDKKKAEQSQRTSFEALKRNVLQSKRQKTLKNINGLDEEISNLKNQLDKTEMQMDSTKKTNLVRNLCIQFKKRLFSYFHKWRKFNYMYQLNLYRIRQMLYKGTKLRLLDCFVKWEERALQLKYLSQREVNEEIQTHIDGMNESLKGINRKIGLIENQKYKVKILKFKRVLNQRNRMLQFQALNYWYNAQNKFAKLEAGTIKLLKLFNRHSQKVCLEKYRNIIQDLSWMRTSEYKIQSFNNMLNTKLLRTIINSWFLLSERRRISVIRLFHLNKKVELRKRRLRFESWKLHSSKITDSEYNSVNSKLVKEIKDEDQKIASLKIQIVKNEEEILDQNKIKLMHCVHNIFKEIKYIIYEKLLRSFRKWRQKNRDSKRLKSIILASASRWKYLYTIDAFNKWRKFFFNQKISEIHENLTKSIKEYETINSDNIHAVNQIEQTHESLKNQIEELNYAKEKMEDRLNKLVETMYNLSNFSAFESKKRYAFRGWNESIAKEKNAFALALKTSSKLISSHIYSVLKARYQTMCSRLKTRSLWKKAFNAIKRSFVRIRFYNWRLEAKKNLGAKLLKKEEELKEKVNNLEQLKNFIYEKNNNGIISIIDKIRKEKIFFKWIEGFRARKERNMRKAALIDILNHMKLRYSFNHIIEYSDNINDERIKLKNLQVLLSMKKKRRLFKSWHNIFIRESTLSKYLSKLSNKYIFQHKYSAFLQLIGYSVLKAQEIDQNQKLEKAQNVKNARVNKVLNICNLLERVKFNQIKKKADDQLLSHVIMRSFNKKRWNALTHWMQKAKEFSLAVYLEEEGPRAIEATCLERQLNGMKSYIIDEQKYHEDVVNNSVNSNLKDSNLSLVNAIKVWRLSDPQKQIKYKVLTLWKLWLQHRDKVQQVAKFITDRLKFKELGFAFHKWKNLGRIIAKPFREFNKENLMTQVLNDERDISLLNHQNLKQSKNIEALTFENLKLNENFTKGKKMGINVLLKILKAFLYKQLKKWQRISSKCKIFESRVTLAEKMAELENIRATNLNLNGIHQELLIENEDLRQASLDGIEIAKIIQQLTREREQMSVDLSNKSLTIKKLLEENSILSKNIREAELEAKKLSQLLEGK